MREELVHADVNGGNAVVGVARQAGEEENRRIRLAVGNEQPIPSVGIEEVRVA